MRNNSDLLFNKKDLRKVMEKQVLLMQKEINNYPQNKLLNTSEIDLIDYFIKKYSINPLKLLEDNMYVDQEEVEIDVSHDRSRFILDRSKPLHIKGTKVTLFVPFEGDQSLFQCQPSTFSLNPPRGYVQNNILHISISITDHDSDNVQKKLNNQFKSVNKYVNNINSDLKPWNNSLNNKAKNIINKRKKKLLKDRELIDNLDFPIKRRKNDELTYIVPEVKRKVNPKPPEASNKQYKPEPALDMNEYEHIIEVINKTAKMLERSPKTFKDMGEEQLRDQFLVPLNSHYEGQTTSETFNSSGKTDILIRVEDRSIFIAECKIWRGKKALSDAIDQLLSYTTWRDTKTSLIIFNRNKNLTNVLIQIEPVIIDHSSCKKKLKYDKETGFRFVLGHPDDFNREIILTALVFDVPG